MRVYMHVCVSVYVRLCVCMFACLFVFICACMHVCVYRLRGVECKLESESGVGGHFLLCELDRELGGQCLHL
jgi:hypothetical protein